MQGDLTSVEAEIGAAVGHVKIYAAAAPGILQNLGEGVRHLLGTSVGHPLAPMSQPPCAAHKQGSQYLTSDPLCYHSGYPPTQPFCDAQSPTLGFQD